MTPCRPPQVTVKCLQVIVRSVDAKTLAKSLPEFIRTSMLTFFNNAAIDLEHCILCLQEVRGRARKRLYHMRIFSFKLSSHITKPSIKFSLKDGRLFYIFGVNGVGMVFV